jgi:CRP/FNR family cyclic AMP-dependent transcriptional regulator
LLLWSDRLITSRRLRTAGVVFGQGGGNRVPGLEQIALLKDIDPEYLARFNARCRWQVIDENELVVDFDDHDNDVYFIASGIVRALYRGPSGREVILGELRDGDLFGELAAIDEVGRSANVTALCRTELGKMSGEVFREMVTGHPEVSLLVMRILTERVRALNIRLTEHSMLNSRERLYAELLRLSEARKADPKQRSISPPPVQQDLANRIGCRREVVSREIACLRRDGILQSTKGALILIEPSELNRRISAAMNQE